ncbi:hypothetical protein L1887_62042 [Cichorium endivia]|nr:hypothetical protein L1887_62042 [Cichorium endivia]
MFFQRVVDVGFEDDVAGGAGYRAFACTFEVDIVLVCDAEQIVALVRLDRLDGLALGVDKVDLNSSAWCRPCDASMRKGRRGRHHSRQREKRRSCRYGHGDAGRLTSNDPRGCGNAHRKLRSKHPPKPTSDGCVIVIKAGGCDGVASEDPAYRSSRRDWLSLEFRLLARVSGSIFDKTPMSDST